MKQEKKGPKMRAKAAEGRHLLIVLMSMLDTFYNPPKDELAATQHQCVRPLFLLYEEPSDWKAGESEIKVA
eukprot:8526643-Pyramimonas_sp.AAC.1